MVAILISVLFATIISIIWVYFIDKAKEHHPDYKGEDLFGEKVNEICSKHGYPLKGKMYCSKCLEENNI